MSPVSNIVLLQILAVASATEKHLTTTAVAATSYALPELPLLEDLFELINS